MKLEEARRIMEEWSNTYYKEVGENDDSLVIDTVLEALENSIPKKKIEDKIEELKFEGTTIEATTYLDRKTIGIIELIEVIVNTIEGLIDNKDNPTLIKYRVGDILDKYGTQKYEKKIKNRIETLKEESKRGLRGIKGQDRRLAKQEYQQKINVLQGLLEES